MYKFLSVVALAAFTACSNVEKSEPVSGGGVPADTTSGGDKITVTGDSTIKVQ